MSEVRLSSVLGPAFHLLARDAFRHGHTHYDLSGGRGSLKSSAVSLLVPLLLIHNPGTHALILRKVANTIRDSVYAQYLWAIGELGMAEYWDAKVQPMELIYKPTGQKIMFRGADDPMKIKSIKVPFGYIAVTHFEEKDQFAGRAEIRTILQSTMRGGSKFWNFESYNPPISRDNWANKDSLEERADRLCHKSTYLEAPPEWLGAQFLAEADHLKETDERAYRHEYLGEAVGTGGNVFENLELREITDAEATSFDHIYQGVDWGWFPDPFAFIRLHYDRARETIYLMDEIYQNKLTNEDSGKLILSRGYKDAYITCDSAEPKSAADYRSIWPLSWQNGVITECAFDSIINVNGEDYCYLQIHRKIGGLYDIENRLYTYRNQNVGTEIPLASVQGFERVPPVVHTGSDRRQFVIDRPNIANNLDYTIPLGISVYANAIDSLKGVDVAFDSYINEFVLGKKRVMVKPSTLNYLEGEPVFDPDDLAYYVLPEDIEGGAVITPIDMTLRTAEHSEGIQTQLNLLSSKCGFGENHYRFDQGSIATATQVISENSTMFRTIKKHEIILDQAIKELCRIILRLGNTAMGASLNEEAQVTIDFDDSIIEDKTTERNNDRQDLAAGIMNDWEYRAKWYNEDEVTAKKMLPKMEDTTLPPRA